MPITVADFRRHALALLGAVEGAHMGHPDFRLDNRIFATLSGQAQGRGVLKLTLGQQQSFIQEMPAVFSPVQGGWGRMGMTFIHLAAADQSILQGALAAAHHNLELKQPSAKQKKMQSAKPAPTGASKTTAPRTARPKPINANPTKAKSTRNQA